MDERTAQGNRLGRLPRASALIGTRDTGLLKPL